ncbi:hypothetical protein [Phenylobacterium sp.]|uniref:hypothetical protein n=1 Tax=Phenylobacterium sp. TaxID=1871053 RepID=UPI0025DEBD6A|nr:hypothetical protein [Phenylobacterium sp.]
MMCKFDQTLRRVTHLLQMDSDVSLDDFIELASSVDTAEHLSSYLNLLPEWKDVLFPTHKLEGRDFIFAYAQVFSRVDENLAFRRMTSPMARVAWAFFAALCEE